MIVGFDGYWGKMELVCHDRGFVRTLRNDSIHIFYFEEDGPWDAFLKLSIDGFKMPSEKSYINVPIKGNKIDNMDYINNLNFREYTGTVEYYVCDEYPSIYDAFKKNKKPYFVTPTRDDGMPTKKITSKAKIKIKTAFIKNETRYHRYYSDHYVYVIEFDNVSLCIYCKTGL